MLKNLDALAQKQFVASVEGYKQTLVDCLEKMTLNAFELVLLEVRKYKLFSPLASKI